MLYQAFGFRYHGRHAMNQADVLELRTAEGPPLVSRLIELYTLTEGTLITGAMHIVPFCTLRDVRQVLQSALKTRVTMVALSRPHVACEKIPTPVSVGYLRTRIRWTLFEGRHRKGFEGFMRRTLPRDMFGQPNPAYRPRIGAASMTTEDLPGDNNSDYTLPIEDGNEADQT